MSAINFDRLSPSHFRCNLEGVDKKWVNIDSDGWGRYSNLPDGVLTLKAQAKKDNGLWGDMKTVTIIVHPPFWRTPSFWGLVAAVFVGTLGIWVSQREKKLKAQKRYLNILVEERTEKVQLQKKEIEQQAIKLKNKNSELKELHEFKLNAQATIVHDLITPLNKILNLSEDEEVREACFDLLGLTYGLLNVQTVKEAKLILKTETVDLNKLFEKVWMKNLFRATQKSINLDFEPCLDAFVLADKSLLVRVLTNLLVNSIKHSPQNGRLSVKIENKADTVVFKITNGGIPIPEGLQKTLFDKFVKGDQKGSIGLGLFFCKMAMEALDGSIGLCHTSAGNRFLITLPKNPNNPKKHEAEDTGYPSPESLNEDERRAILALSKTPVYEVGKILRVLKMLAPESSLSDVWKMEVMTTVYSGDAERFKHLIRVVQKG